MGFNLVKQIHQDDQQCLKTCLVCKWLLVELCFINCYTMENGEQAFFMYLLWISPAKKSLNNGKCDCTFKETVKF